jgi:hypothetical protein
MARISPVKARAGNSHQTCGSIFKVWINAAVCSGVIASSPREVTLKYWKVRNTAAPATALKICARTRVLFGPISLNSPVTISNAMAVATKASVTMKTIADSQRGDEKMAIQSNGGPSRPA